MHKQQKRKKSTANTTRILVLLSQVRMRKIQSNPGKIDYGFKDSAWRTFQMPWLRSKEVKEGACDNSPPSAIRYHRICSIEKGLEDHTQAILA